MALASGGTANESWHPTAERDDTSLGGEPMLRAAAAALSRLCSAPQGWALEIVIQIQDRIREISSSGPLR
eukprot:5559509-Pyramimonas_sp.AAC.1